MRSSGSTWATIDIAARWRRRSAAVSATGSAVCVNSTPRLRPSSPVYLGTKPNLCEPQQTGFPADHEEVVSSRRGYGFGRGLRRPLAVPLVAARRHRRRRRDRRGGCAGLPARGDRNGAGSRRGQIGCSSGGPARASTTASHRALKFGPCRSGACLNAVSIASSSYLSRTTTLLVSTSSGSRFAAALILVAASKPEPETGALRS